MIQEEIIAKLEVATQIEVVAGVECKTGPSTDKRLPHFPRIQKENDPKA
jgi:hypothetical protein